MGDFIIPINKWKFAGFFMVMILGEIRWVLSSFCVPLQFLCIRHLVKSPNKLRYPKYTINGADVERYSKNRKQLNVPLISCDLICNFTPTDVLQKESEKFIAPPCKSHLFTPSQLQEKHVPPPHRHLSPNPPMDAELLAEPDDFSPSFEANAVRSDFHPQMQRFTQRMVGRLGTALIFVFLNEPWKCMSFCFPNVCASMCKNRNNSQNGMSFCFFLCDTVIFQMQET